MNIKHTLQLLKIFSELLQNAGHFNPFKHLQHIALIQPAEVSVMTKEIISHLLSILVKQYRSSIGAFFLGVRRKVFLGRS